jgi:hypothetical protein
MCKLTDEAWLQGRLHHHYYRHRKGYVRIDTDLLEVLRERHWKHVHAEIAKEIALLIPLVLIPLGDEREEDHETGTLFGDYMTVRCKSEPL